MLGDEFFPQNRCRRLLVRAVHLKRAVRPRGRRPKTVQPAALEMLDDERRNLLPFRISFVRQPAPAPDLDGRTDHGQRDGKVANICR